MTLSQAGKELIIVEVAREGFFSDGHADDVRAIWPLKQRLLLNHERDLSSKPHSV